MKTCYVKHCENGTQNNGTQASCVLLFGVPFFELPKVVVCTVYIAQVEKHLTEVFLIFSPPQLQCL